MSEIIIPAFGVEKLDRLRKELLKALRTHGYEITEAGEVLFTRARLLVGGCFPTVITRHKAVQRAMEEGDPEKVAAAQRWVRRMGFHRTGVGYMEVASECPTNKIPDAALTNLLAVWLGVVAKKSAWYLAPFSSDSTPAAAWASNWGAVSGGVATEFTDYDETGRQTWARDAAASQAIANTTKTEFTVSTGVTDANIYGMTLNSVATQEYAVTDQILAAASRYTSAKVVNATDVMSVGYTIQASSTT